MRKTIGIDWKVPITAVVSIVAWVILHYTGLDLSADVEVIVALILGGGAGAIGPAPITVTKDTPQTIPH